MINPWPKSIQPVGDQPNHLKIFQKATGGGGGGETSAGVVVRPTKERLELPVWRWQKLALTWAKPALLLFVCRRAGVEEE